MKTNDDPFPNGHADDAGYDRGGALVERAVESGVASVKYELAAAYAMARDNPRDELACVARMLKAAKRPRFADDATYEYPRGGEKVRGPSVYVARSIAVAWGHVRHGTKVLESDEEYETIQGYATDMQTGAHVTQEDRYKKVVQRKIAGKTQWVKADERDLRELRNRRGAMLERNCILAIVPTDVVDDVLDACYETLKAQAEGNLGVNREDTQRKLVATFDEMGVGRAELEMYIGGTKLEAMSAEQLMSLRNVLRSIQRGEAHVGTYFDVRRPVAAAASAPAANGPKMPDMSAARSVAPRDPAGGAPIGTSAVKAEPSKPAEQSTKPLFGDDSEPEGDDEPDPLLKSHWFAEIEIFPNTFPDGWEQNKFGSKGLTLATAVRSTDPKVLARIKDLLAAGADIQQKGERVPIEYQQLAEAMRLSRKAEGSQP